MSSVCYGYQQRVKIFLHLQDHHTEYNNHSHENNDVSKHQHGEESVEIAKHESLEDQSDEKTPENGQEPQHSHNTSVNIDNLWSGSHEVATLKAIEKKSLKFSNRNDLLPSDYVSKLYRPPKNS